MVVSSVVSRVAPRAGMMDKMSAGRWVGMTAAERVDWSAVSSAGMSAGLLVDH